MGRVLEPCRVALVALALTIGAIPAVASAQGRPGATLDPARRAEAKRLFDGGADLYAQGDYEGAISAWMKSYEISGLPLIFESVANAHERLGRPRQAREALLRWREAAPPDEHELLDRRLRNLDERIARLEADERAAAEARARGEEARRQQGEGRSTEVEPTPPPGQGSPLVPIGIVVGAVGLGAIGAGLVVGAVAAGQRPDEEAACRTSSGGSLCLASERDAIESSSSLALVSDVLWIAGSAAAVTGVVLVVVGSSDGDEPGLRAILTPHVGPTGTGATLQGAF